MGSKRDLLTILIMFCALSWKQVQASGNHSALNSLLYDYAFKTIQEKPRTGRLYEVPLPLNLSGLEVSVIRLRTHSLWKNGANFTSIEVPKKVLPQPFTRRVDLVYQNLGNWSSTYYNVPNHTFLTPVVGLLAYDSSMSSINHRLMQLNVRGDSPIIFRFNISASPQGGAGMRCVRFGAAGAPEFSNVGPGATCAARDQGHFSIVEPTRDVAGETAAVRWWMVGIPAGVVIVIAAGIVGFVVVKRRRFRKMERESEKSEVLGSVWIGDSRMPSASGIRTQPVLENSYVP